MQKKGYPFLVAGALDWFLMGERNFFIEDRQVLALFYLIGSGCIFPLAIVISPMLKANILSKNPLGDLEEIIGVFKVFIY